MSDTIKGVIIKKAVQNNVLFRLSPLSNPSLSKEIYLTNRLPQQALPIDWALGIFLDDAVYNMYKQGVFTFDNNEGLFEAAKEAGVYFSDEMEFTPAEANRTDKILAVLEKGVRSEIMDAVQTYGKDLVKDVTIANLDKLTNGVIQMLENLLHVQLILDEE